jgi:hypothetical protein
MKSLLIFIIIPLFAYSNFSFAQERELPCVNIQEIQSIKELTVLINWEGVNILGLLGYKVRILNSNYSEVFNATTSSNNLQWEANNPGPYMVQVAVVVNILGIKIVGPFCDIIQFFI